MLTCPQCETQFVRRSRRRGFVEHVLSFILLFPFRCQLCTRRFLAFSGTIHHVPLREYVRVPIRLPVSYGSVNASEQIRGEGMTVNLSIRGCGLESDPPLKQGTALRLELRTGEREGQIAIQSAVVRSVQDKRAGIEFLEMREEDEIKLGRLKEKLLSSGAPGALFTSSVQSGGGEASPT